MTRKQRYQHEMLVRVRDFGAAHAEQFPESSPGGGKFAQVSAAVAAIEDHMKNRVLGFAGTRGVSETPRKAVFRYMRTLAHAARQIARKRRSQAPFVLPRKRRLKVEVTTARAFLEAAGKRQAEFVAMGLPHTFLADFRSLVDELDGEVNGRLNGKTLRGQARLGITAELRRGMHLVGDLDVIVDVVARGDDVVSETWRIARRVEGQRSAESTSSSEVEKADPPATPVVDGDVDAPAPEVPPAVPDDGEGLRRVS